MARATRATTKRPASPAPDSAPAAKQPRKTRGAKAKAEPVDEDSPEPEDKKKPAPKKGKTNAKVKAEASEDELDGDDTVPTKTAQKKDAKGHAKVKTEQPEDGEDDAVEEKKAAPTTEFKEAQVAKAGKSQIPLDEGAPTYFHVFIDPADQLIYDASLNQTNASGNNNKFYRVQVCYAGHVIFLFRLLTCHNSFLKMETRTKRGLAGDASASTVKMRSSEMALSTTLSSISKRSSKTKAV